MKRRILVLSHMYPNAVNEMSGIFVHNQSKALRDAGNDIRVVVPIPSFPLFPKWKGYRNLPRETTLDGIPVYYVPTRMFPRGLFFSYYGEFYFRAVKPIIDTLKEEFPFDLIHCHTIFPDGYTGAKLKNEYGVPVVSTIHGSDILLYPKRTKRIYQRTVEALQENNHVITVSRRLQEEAEKMVEDLPVSTIYNGFDPKQFFPIDREEAREKLALPLQGKKILFVGNLLPVKGVPYLLQAFQQLLQKERAIDLYLIGTGPLEGELRKQAQELGIAEKTHFMGRKPHDQIPLWVNSADVVVLTSLSEGLPSILLESMGCGRPMVATDVGGIKEILQDGVTGKLANSQDVDHITSCLQEVLLIPDDDWNKLSQSSYTASKNYTWKRNAELVGLCYQQLLNNKSI